MANTYIADLYISQLDDLETIVFDANQKIISEIVDDFVYRNANFFTKSFLVIACAYIESYTKDILMHVIEEINVKLLAQKLPESLIRWGFGFKDHLEKNYVSYDNLKIKIAKKDLDKFISGNPYLAVKLFNNFGIDLMGNSMFVDQKEVVNTIVLKRNRVVHHNDDASDISNGDLVGYIIIIKAYIANIDFVVQEYLKQ